MGDARRAPARRLPVDALTCVTCLVGLVVAVRFSIRYAYSVYDDAYIYFTYAENVARGCGLVFRCDGSPPVEGFTSPLYMALLLLCRLVTADLETAAILLGVLGMGLALWFAALTAARAAEGHVAWLAAAAALAALALDDFVLINSVIGLETALFAAVVTSMTWAMATERPHAMSACLALALWTRPEGVLLSLSSIFTPAGRTLRFWIAPSLALLALLVARLTYYGELLPNTYYAKSGGTPQHAVLGAAYVADVFRDYPAIALAPLALRVSTLRPVVLGLLAASALLLGSFLRSGGDLFGYGRLFVPFVPSLTACAAIGLAGLGRELRPTARALLLVPLFAWAAWVANAHALVPRHGFANVMRWRQVGSYLCRMHAGERIATVPIGAISYFSGLAVIDMVGLTSREIARAGRTVPQERLTRAWIGHERHNTEWVLSQRPSLIVFGTKFGTTPVHDVRTMRAGFYAEWELLQLAIARQIPYEPYSPEIAPGVYWHMLRASWSEPKQRPNTKCP